MLMSLFVIDRLEKNKPVPLMLSEKNGTIWNWCILIVSKMGGSWKPPLVKGKQDRKKKEQAEEEEEEEEEEEKEDEPADGQQQPHSKKRRTEAGESKDRDAEQKRLVKARKTAEASEQQRRDVYADLQHIFDNSIKAQLEPQLPRTNPFPWPDRRGLNRVLTYEVTKRVTTFNNYYGTTLLGRQAKVVRRQIDELASYRALEVELGGNKDKDKDKDEAGKDKAKNALRTLCTRFVVAHVNRYSQPPDFDAEWQRLRLKLAGQAGYRQLKDDLRKIVAEHQQGFGDTHTSPLASECYRLSEQDAMRHAALYVPYFHYLSKQYDTFRVKDSSASSTSTSSSTSAISTAATTATTATAPTAPSASRTKWKPFPVVPQCSDRVPFIELDAECILGLKQISKLPAAQESLLKHLQSADKPANLIDRVAAASLHRLALPYL